MRRLALLGCLLSCAEWRMQPTFPEQAAGRPVVHEQAIVGLSPGGDAAVVELVDADGEAPRLRLLAFAASGAPSRALLDAPADRAAAVATRVRAEGRILAPILRDLVSAAWPEAAAAAVERGYPARAAVRPDAGADWTVAGAPGAGALPLSLRVAPASHPVDSLVLLLSDGAAAEEIEIARMPLAGAAIAPALFIERDTAWLLAGSVLAGDPLHRAVGVRRGALRRGEAQLHNLHGLADSAASDLDAAQREFARAIAADATFVDALYNAAAAAAREKREEEAVAFLRRASALDPDRVQVLGRSDDDLASLRKRADVRALLGQRRLPPEGVPPPP